MPPGSSNPLVGCLNSVEAYMLFVICYMLFLVCYFGICYLCYLLYAVYCVDVGCQVIRISLRWRNLVYATINTLTLTLKCPGSWLICRTKVKTILIKQLWQVLQIALNPWSDCGPHHKDRFKDQTWIYYIHMYYLHKWWKSHTSLGSVCDNGRGNSNNQVLGMQEKVIS